MKRCQRLFVSGQVTASHHACDPLQHDAYLLKQQQSLSIWQGNLLHRILTPSFLTDRRAGCPIDLVALSADAHRLAHRQCAFSAARKYREPGQTKGATGAAYCALYEHEYEQGISSEQQALLAHLAAGSAHLAELPLQLDGSDIKVGGGKECM